MPKKFYIGDWHYGHKNILRFDERPFDSIEEMDEELIRRWNSVVSDEDYVYVVGDMFWITPNRAVKILDRLKGQKFLVVGNHDSINNAEFRKRFVKTEPYMEIKDGGRDIVLCHYPIPFFKNHFYGWYHLYAHVHNTKEYEIVKGVRRYMEDNMGWKCNMANVGAMMPYMNYTPRTFDEIYEACFKE